MGPIDITAPSRREIELELTLKRFEERLVELAADKRSLADQALVQGNKVLRLEAENVRLKMQRTDAALATEVDGLRVEVGRKDRALVDYKRQLDKFLENEKVLLHRAAVADQKIATLQNTLGTFQKARDAAYAETERHDRERLDAVRAMVDAQDRAKKAEARLAALTNPEALKPKKK